MALIKLFIIGLFFSVVAASPVIAQTDSAPAPLSPPSALSPTSPDGVGSFLSDVAKDPTDVVSPDHLPASLEIMLLLTVLSLAPAILIMTTSFTRIVVVLALLRQAVGTQQLPPSQVIIGLSLFMTFCVMGPTWKNINQDAIQPYVNPAAGTQPIAQGEAWDRSVGHLRGFMVAQLEKTGNYRDVYTFLMFDKNGEAVREKLRQGQEIDDWQQVSTTSLIPAFITSELKQAFIMGFYIYLPFLIVDMVIASILMSMGMMMLPPILISLPFKLLLFVLVDGWQLVVSSLLTSFNPLI